MMPDLLILLIIILAIIVSLLILKKYAKPRSTLEFLYHPKTSLCSPAERSLLGVLEKLLSDQYRTLLKVRLADLLYIQKGVSRSLRQSALNRISQKHVDFVVCGKDDLSILGVIELDDQTHKLPKRQERDSFLDGALNAASIPVLHIQAQNTYSVNEIWQQLQDSFDFLAEKAATDSPRQASEVKDQEKIQPISVNNENYGTCSECGAPLVKKQAKKGKFAGKYFLACASFPKCRKIVPIKQAAN